MAFTEETKKSIESYVDGHMADWDWHKEKFNFISSSALQNRLADEFISTRYVYKMLEGMSANSWLLRAQIRLQVLSYASIYEAVIHHVLFEELSSVSAVQSLTEFNMKKVISIPSEKQVALQDALEHDGRTIIPTYEGIGRTDITKVRFDRKAECASSLGLIEDWLKEDIIEFYEARNAIHIHAEIRKSLEYQLDLSKRAYMRMEPFTDQIGANLPRVIAENA